MTLVVAGMVLLSAILHASWNALLHSGRDRLWTMTVMSLAMGAVGLATIPFLPLPDPASWPYIVASGLLEVGYNVFLVLAYRYGELGQVYPIARGSSPMLVTLGAAVFVGEEIGLVTAFGIALVSTGIVALAFRGRRISAASVAAALATACFIAGYTVVDGAGVRLAGNSFAYTAWMVVVWAAPMPLILYAARGRAAFAAPREEVLKAAAGGLVALAAYGTIIWAMQFGPMGPISALRETSVVFAAIIARIYLREALTAHRLLGCLAIAAGAACLGYDP